jgi:nucleotide-binding universal stress UspA family protein
MKALVPLDGSSYATRILSTVRRLVALQPDIEIHLATIMDPKSTHGRQDHGLAEAPAVGVGSMHVTSPLPRLVESHGEAMDRHARETREWLTQLGHTELSGVPLEAHVVWTDHTAEGINLLAQEVGADVIVMASHGRSGLSHLVAGSVTEAVIRTATRPVLVQGPAID